MQAVLLLVALSLPGQEPTRVLQPRPGRAEVTRPDPAERSDTKADPTPTVEMPKVFTLDEIAMGARNDAFVDEFLKDKQLTLHGQVHRIERVVEQATNDADPLAKANTTYRLVMQRLGHEDRIVDLQIHFVFTPAARKDLALLEPGTTKVTVQGKCVSTQLQMLERGLNFAIELQGCQIVPTPMELDSTAPRSRTPIIPNIIPDSAPPVVPRNPPSIPPPPPPLPVPNQD